MLPAHPGDPRQELGQARPRDAHVVDELGAERLVRGPDQPAGLDQDPGLVLVAGDERLGRAQPEAGPHERVEVGRRQGGVVGLGDEDGPGLRRQAEVAVPRDDTDRGLVHQLQQ